MIFPLATNPSRTRGRGIGNGLKYELQITYLIVIWSFLVGLFEEKPDYYSG